MALADTGLLILRLGLGLVFLAHSIPKLRMPKKMAKGMGMGAGAVVILGLVETLAALSVVLGFFSRIGALLLALIMLGAIYHKMFVWKVPFTSMKKTGWEFDLILLAAALVVAFAGAGSIALNAFLFF